MTWEFDEIVAGGQADRYAMVQMFAPYGTLINDPKLSKTGGKWAWTTVPGPTSPDQGRTWIDGHNHRRCRNTPRTRNGRRSSSLWPAASNGRSAR